MQPRVVIIGGGVIGASCLYHLTRRGLTSVTLVEKDALCSGSSGRSAAMVETQYNTERDIFLRVKSIALFHHLERTAGLPFVHHGYLRLGHSPAEMAVFERSLNYQRELGIRHATLLDPDGIAREVPGLRVDDLTGALYGPEDGYIDPHLYVNIMVEQARQRGAAVHTFTPVTGIVTRRGRVEAVETGRGRLPADFVVNAAGAWARHIGEMVGLSFPVDGYRHQIAVLRPDRDLGKIPFVIDYIPGAREMGVYFRDETGGLVLAGLHKKGYDTDAEKPADPDDYGAKADWSFIEQLMQRLNSRYPIQRDFAVQTGWAGLYPLTPDTDPILGEVPGLRGFINAIGFGGSGVQLSPVAGQIIAELIVDGQVGVVPDLSPYSIERFG